MHLQAFAPAMPHLGTKVSGYAWELAKMDTHLFLPPSTSQPGASHVPHKVLLGCLSSILCGWTETVTYRPDCYSLLIFSALQTYSHTPIFQPRKLSPTLPTQHWACGWKLVLDLRA